MVVVGGDAWDRCEQIVFLVVLVSLVSLWDGMGCFMHEL